MRWALVIVESLVTGVVTLFAAIFLLLIVLRFTIPASKRGTTAVGWDPISIFMGFGLSQGAAKVVALAIPATIFAVGFAVGFWLFSKPLRRF